MKILWKIDWKLIEKFFYSKFKSLLKINYSNLKLIQN